jgi:hypothetical protein
MKRYKLIPKRCSRCGNDFMTGSATLFLPYEKRYICLCLVCVKGLELPIQLVENPRIENAKNETLRWKKFWNEEVK